MYTYSENIILEEWCNLNQFEIVSKESVGDSVYRNYWLTFNWNQQTYTILVDDEYADLEINNSDLHLLLVLFSLELFIEMDSYEEWCHEHFLDINTSGLINYYKNLKPIFEKFESYVMKIPITVYELQLNMGPIQELRNTIDF